MRLLILDFRLWIEKQSGDRTHPQMGYVDKLLAAFAPSEVMPQSKTNHLKSEMVEPLSQRELEILQAHCPGTLESRDWRAAFPGPGHDQRA